MKTEEPKSIFNAIMQIGMLKSNDFNNDVKKKQAIIDEYEKIANKVIKSKTPFTEWLKSQATDEQRAIKARLIELNINA